MGNFSYSIGMWSLSRSFKKNVCFWFSFTFKLIAEMAPVLFWLTLIGKQRPPSPSFSPFWLIKTMELNLLVLKIKLIGLLFWLLIENLAQRIWLFKKVSNSFSFLLNELFRAVWKFSESSERKHANSFSIFNSEKELLISMTLPKDIVLNKQISIVVIPLIRLVLH